MKAPKLTLRGKITGTVALVTAIVVLIGAWKASSEIRQSGENPWLFDVEPGTLVLTTTYVMTHREPILFVSHDEDPEEGPVWQFHFGNRDSSGEVLMLVRLDEVLSLDSSLYELATLPLGHEARRSGVSREWMVAPKP